MKAILVIDIDDSLVEGDERFAVDGYLMQESDCVGCYEAVGRIENAVLKPMPRHKYGFEDNGLRPSDQILIQSGWNACLDEILGETE